MLIQKLVSKSRSLLSNHRASIKIVPSLQPLECGKKITEALRAKKPYLVARIGWMEGYAIGKLLAEGKTPLELREKLALHAGIFPSTPEQLQLFADAYLEAIEEVDILGLMEAPYHGWIIKSHAKHAALAELKSLEPYFLEEPWSWELRGLRVLVVHPFEKSIVNQYKTVREHIFKNQKMLPLFELKVIQAPQTITGNIRKYTSWSETLHALEEQVKCEHFDVALIGCGAYGLPLAATIKKMGKIALHLGGATQLLFGIRGKRWAEHSSFLRYRSIMTEAWTSPLESERPIGWEKIEEGCYW